MSAIVDALLAELDDQALAELAAKLTPYLTGDKDNGDRWLNATQAATHLACSRDRVYDLVQLQKLPARRDGRRLLLRQKDLDAYLELSA